MPQVRMVANPMCGLLNCLNCGLRLETIESGYLGQLLVPWHYNFFGVCSGSQSPGADYAE